MAAVARRQRQSTTAATPAPSTTSSTNSPLPPYEQPQQPLTPAAAQKLFALNSTYPSAQLLQQLRTASDSLTDHAGTLNEELRRTAELAAKRKRVKARQAAANNEEEEAGDECDEEERRLQKFKEDVEAMTQRVENSVMKTIDGEAGINAVQETLRSTQQSSVTRNGGQNAQTQTQRTGRSATEPSATATTITTTTDTEGNATEERDTKPQGLKPAFDDALVNATDDYNAKTKAVKYSEHAVYVGFKSEVHSQRHGEEGPPLPHSSRWFADADEEAAPGVTAGASACADAGDDGVTISRENTSTRCPLTLADFVEPLTSKKCPHSFEKSAILGMLAQQRPQTARRGMPPPSNWARSVQCPVSGCEQVLEEKDLAEDVILARKIKRLQRAKERAASRMREDGEDEEEEEEVGRRGRAEQVESDDEIDVDEEEASIVKPESSRRTQALDEEIEDD